MRILMLLFLVFLIPSEARRSKKAKAPAIEKPLLFQSEFPAGFPYTRVYGSLDVKHGFTIDKLGSITRYKLIFVRGSKKLYLFEQDKLVRTFAASSGVGLGFDKVQSGDRTTPLGLFYLTTKNPQSKFYRSFGLSYPNREDAIRGLRDGLIDIHQFQDIYQAIKDYKTPPQNTKLGSYIMLHGQFKTAKKGAVYNQIAKMASEQNWSDGCIAVQNPDMQYLFDTLPLKTTILILP